MANKGKRMLFEEDYEYLQDLVENHPDPSASWGGGSGGDVNIEAGTGITITGTDTKVISLDTTPSTFEVTASTGTTLEVPNANPLYNDAKLQMTSAGSTRLEGATIDIEGTNIYLHSDSAPYYVNNTSHEYKTLATTDQLFSGNYNDLSNKPTIPDAVSGTNDGTNWTSLTIGEDTYGLASGGTTYTAGMGIDIDANNEISADIKAGYGIVVDEDLSDNSKVIMIDDADIPSYSDLATVATSGSYNDLTDKPTLAEVATTGSYNNLIDKPIIPDPVSGTDDQTNWRTITIGDKTRNIPDAVTGTNDGNNWTSLSIGNITYDIPDAVSGTNDGTNWTSLTIGNDTYGLASGGGTTYIEGYGIDITNDEISVDTAVIATKGDIPTNVSDLNNDAGYITGITSADVTTALGYTPYNSSNPSGYITGITSSDVTTALGYTPGTSNFSGDYTDLTNKPDLSIYAQSANLATVATSGSYADLSNKPTIPTVNDNTITITQGGVTKGSFTLNQSSNQTIALDAGSTPTNMVTTDTAQDITASKSFTGNANIYVQSGATYTASDTMITNRMISASQISGSLVSAHELALEDSTTAGQSQIRVRDFTQTPFVDYRIEVPTKNGTMALTSDIPTVTNSITSGSTDAVTSGAVYNAIGDIESLLAAI